MSKPGKIWLAPTAIAKPRQEPSYLKFNLRHWCRTNQATDTLAALAYSATCTWNRHPFAFSATCRRSHLQAESTSVHLVGCLRPEQMESRPAGETNTRDGRGIEQQDSFARYNEMGGSGQDLEHSKRKIDRKA